MEDEYPIITQVSIYEKDGTNPTTYKALDTISPRALERFNDLSTDYTEASTIKLAATLAHGRLPDDLNKATALALVTRPLDHITTTYATVSPDTVF